MAEIDNAVALGIKPQTPPDVIGPITSLAQLQYLQAHGALEGAQADFQQQKTAAYNQFGQLRSQGASIQDALTGSNLPAFDAPGAASLVTIPNIERQNAAAASYGANPTPANAAGLGPAAYGESINAQKSAVGVQGDVAAQKGQIASELLGGIVTNPDGSQTLPPEVRSDLIQRFKAVRAASGQPLDARTEQFLWSAPVEQLKPLALGMQQGGIAATDTPTVAGAKAGATTAATSANTPIQVSPGNSVQIPRPGVLPGYGAGAGASAGIPATPSTSGAGSPGLSNNSYNNPGNIRDGAFAQSQPGYSGNYKGFAIFSSPLYGQAAAEQNLMSYARQGINTPTAIAARWAPAGDGANNPTAYANFIAGKLGISPDAKIDISNPQQRAALVVAMSQQENGAKNANPGGTAVSATGGAGAGFGGSPMALPPAAGGPRPQPTPLQSAAALPISPAAFTPGKNPLAPPAPPQGTVAPIAPVPAPSPPPPPLVQAPPVAVQQPPVAPPAPANPGMTVLSPGMTLGQKAEQEGQGKAYGELPAQLDTAASSAKRMNTTLDEVSQAVNGSWQPGKWAGVAENGREMLQSVANGLGIQTPGLDKSIANYQDFVKMAGNISRAAAHETSSQVGVQEMELINKSLPSPEVSDGGIKLIVPQMKGLNDFAIAKQQASSAFRSENNGSLGPSPKYGGEDFQTYWNQAASPAAFVLHRMATDNPQGARDVLMKMKSQPNGEQALRNIQQQTQWAHDAGLLN